MEHQPPTPKRPWAPILLGIVLSVLLPVLAFRGVDLAQAWSLLTQCRGSLLVIGGLAFLANLALRSWRWQLMLSSQYEIRYRSALSTTCVGFLANNVLPLKLGDLVRVGALRQLEPVSGARALGSIVVEKLLELLTLTFFLGLYLAFAAAGEHQAELLWAGRVALLGAAVVTGLLVVGYWRRSWFQSLFSRPASWVSPKLGERVHDLTGNFLEGLQIIRSPGQVLAVALLSCAVWGSCVVTYASVGDALGLPLAYSTYVVVAFATAFGSILPAAPGAVGTFHGFARLGLYLVGIHSGEQALAFAVLLHALEWTLMNVTGAYFLVRDRLTLLRTVTDEDPRSNHATPTNSAEAGSDKAEYTQSV